jgi:thioredoxin reductase
MSYDVIVIGGSFAGLSAAMQLARARRRVAIVDSGLPRNRFARTSHGFFGQDGRPPAEIVADARAGVLAYPTAEHRTGEAVDARRRGDGAFEVALASGESLAASRLVLATGVADELADLPGLRERWGATVLHCPYCHGYEVADGALGALAVSELSVHQALLLPDWSGDVTFFTQGIVTLDEAQRSALASRGVRVEPEPVTELLGTAPALDGVRLRDGRTVRLAALFTGSRIRMASPLAERLGCELDDGPAGPIVRTDARKETTVPGVYAAGDMTRFPHNATWASADGVTAGISAHQSLALPAMAARS